MTKEKNILVFIDWYLPGYKAGGPIQSIANLVGKMPYNFWIVTSLFDHATETPYEDTEEATWIKRRENENIMYFGDGGPSGKALKSLLTEREYDTIYLNSLFSTTYALKPLWSAKKLGLTDKIILAPRGMLKSGALSVKSKKKTAFLTGAKTIGLFKGITWHATNEVEQQEIKSYFGKNTSVKIAPNLPRNIEDRKRQPEKKKGELKLITVARVSHEKNILGGIDYLQRLDNTTIHWTIFGTLQDEHYLKKCQELASKLPHLTISFEGEIEPRKIPKELQENHFFYLPTLGENYGHAIAEALLNSVPVIISDKTPWQGLEEKFAGWALPLEKDSFHTVLSECVNMDDSVYQDWVEGAKTAGYGISHDHKALKLNKLLFSINPR